MTKRSVIADLRGSLREVWSSRSFKVAIGLWALIAVLSVVRAPSFLFGWDSFGYHLYLPATFIHDDPFVRDISWVEDARARYDASGTLYQVSTLAEGTRVIKYPMGLAVLWAPWFAIGHVVAGLSGDAQDGYSAPYEWSVHVGMLVLFLLGLLALRIVLRSAFSEGVSAVVLFLLTLATNLLDQSTAGMAMPHLPLFCLYALMLYFIVRWKSSGSWRAVVGFAVSAGMAMLIRPSEAVCLLLPAFWCSAGNEQRMFVAIRERIGQWALILFVLGIFGSAQLLYWHAATGHGILDTYNNAGEGFDFKDPHTLPFLFGFRKGWYIYTPLMLLATLGIPHLRRWWSAAFVPVLVFFLVNIYLLSSWTCWWYADSFGSRAMVGSYAVMALPLAAAIAWAGSIPRGWRWLVRAALAGCILLNVFQHWQYHRGLIHSSRMTFAAWKATLGKRWPPENLERLLLVQRSTTAEQGLPDKERYSRKTLPDRFIALPPSDHDTLLMDSAGGVSRRAYRIDRDHPYTPAIRIPYRVLTSADHAWVEATWHIRQSHLPMSASIVHHFARDTSIYAYSARDLGPLDASADGWSTIRTWYLTPEVRSKDDELVLYFWSRDTIDALVDGPHITVLDPIDLP